MTSPSTAITKPSETNRIRKISKGVLSSELLQLSDNPTSISPLDMVPVHMSLATHRPLEQLSATIMEPALTLANIPLDLHIEICIYLHPSDILTLRKTCKALELATRKRIVWVAALHRVCLDNTLFLPSFSIPDMSDLELERAAMGPRRWMELCGAFQKQHSNDFSKMLHPRTTRIIEDKLHYKSFIVPGGRYLVTAGDSLSVWDLGYVSTVDCKLVASVKLKDGFALFMVQATPDGKGLVILSGRMDHLSIFEIYPQSEIPLLDQIAHYDLPSEEDSEPAHLLPDTLIFRGFYDDRIVFRVVDYRTNYSTCFSADVGIDLDFGSFETFAMKTAIMVFCEKFFLIWAIPPLTSQPSDLRDRFLDNNPAHIPPLSKIPFPDGIVGQSACWMTVSPWYFESVYFDILYEGSDSLERQRFKIIIKPDLSYASLINMSIFISDDLMSPYDDWKGYRICEDALVYFWDDDHWRYDSQTWRTYTGLTSAPFTSVVTQCNGHVESFCPSSGRFVYGTDVRDIAVVDLF